MTRSVKEWVGRTPDTKIPPRVEARVRARFTHCGFCSMPILDVEKTETDHHIALINGGENRESNLRPLHVKCHKIKTKADVAEKSKIAKKKAGVRGMGQTSGQKIKQRPKGDKVAKEDKPKRVGHLDHLPRRNILTGKAY